MEGGQPAKDKRDTKKISYPNGSSYTGEIDANERREGFGTLILADGTVIEGTWRNDDLIKGRQINMEFEMLYEGNEA